VKVWSFRKHLATLHAYPNPCLSHKGYALFAGHGFRALGSDAFDICTMSSFPIPGIAGDHTVLVQKV
jgi:hypothetical protein